DGLQPFEITEARRGSEHGNGLAAFKALLSRLIVAVDEAAHPACGGVPAAGDERAEGAAHSGFSVDMEELRIISARKPQDGLAGEAALAEIKAHSRFAFLKEQSHHGRRSLTRLTPVTSIFFSPAVEKTSQSIVMMPISGVLADRRLARMVKRAVSV